MKLPKYIAVAPDRSPERLMTLADGVFAIVMTLLVFQLGVKGIAETANNTEVWNQFL